MGLPTFYQFHAPYNKCGILFAPNRLKHIHMKRKLTLFLRGTACATILCLSGVSSYASHLVGADLFYTHLSDSTYKVTFVAYGDCGPASAAAFSTLPISAPQVCVFDGSTSVATLALAIEAPDSGIEVTPSCLLADTTQCVNPSSSIPGIKKFVYSATYTMPHRSSFWRFVYSGSNGTSGAAAGRASSITNISSAASGVIQLTDTLDNTTFNNSNPALTASQQTFFCMLMSDYYTPGAVDPDADSLDITLAPAIMGTEACGASGGSVTYIASASASAPLSVITDSFSLNSSTGELYFVPSGLQRSVLVYNIREYRGGVFVGSSQREMTVLAVECTPSSCLAGHVYGSSLIVTNPATRTHFEILPNPANNELTVSIDKGVFSSFTITNTTGATVMQQNLTSLQTKVNISALQPGMYYITVKGQSGTGTQKFIKM